MYASSMAQRNVSKSTVPDRRVWHPHSLHPPVLSLLCAWARQIKTRTQKGQAIRTYVRPASKTPVNKKIYRLNTLHLYQCKLENEQRKSYRILISSCQTTHVRLLDFYRKRGLGPDQIHYNNSRLWSRLHNTLAQITRITPKWIYAVLEISSPCRILEKLALALKNRICPKLFHCFEIFDH